MIPDLSNIFSRYEQLRAQADALFLQVRSQFPNCVTCQEGCADCCHALFDLSLVEAMYIKRAFEHNIPYGPERSALITEASETDRKLTKLKRDLFYKEKDGVSQEQLLTEAASLRIKCPLLSNENKCLLYNDRPITCRLYGIPTIIDKRGHVCGLSNFKAGINYPTVHLDKIQARLEALSSEIATTVHSRFTELDQVYVPLSMALLTKYDEQYLGIGSQKED